MEIRVKSWNDYIPQDIDISKIDVYEYPNDEQFFELKQNTEYVYVSSSYLNGLINYVKPLYLVCSQKYTYYEEFDKIIEKLQKINMDAWPCSWYHTDFSEIEDNIYYLGETDSSYIIFNYDRDCSDCAIARLDKKDFTFEQAKIYMMEQAKYEAELYSYNVCNLRYIELPNPQGWIKG